MSTSVKPSEFKLTRSELLRLILDESDKRIAAQVQVMVAADARATGILAAAVALAAAAFALAADHASDQLDPLFWAALVFGMSSSGSALAAVWALWPTEIQVPGWSPRLFRTDMDKSLSAIRAEMIALNQDKITENARCGGELGRRARLAMCLLALGPLAAAVAGGLAVGTTMSVGVSAFLSEIVLALGMSVSRGIKKA